MISANAIWYVQVGALVVGHVIGLTLAHDRATAYWGDYRQAARSQYWMLAVMVAFTCFGLYLLSVANGERQPMRRLLPCIGARRRRTHLPSGGDARRSPTSATTSGCSTCRRS